MISNTVRIQLVDSDQLGFLDVKAGTTFPITKAIADIRNVSERSGTFTKSITLVGNKNNNTLLNHYFNLNVTANAFDVNKIQPCIVIQDGVVILDNMYLRLKEIKTNETHSELEYENVEYIVSLRNSVSDFFKDINNKYINELTGWNLFNHEYSVANIVSSFGHTYEDGYKYILPWIDNNEYSIKELLPAIYAKQIYDRIHLQAGYTYEWDTFDDEDVSFDKMVIPYGGDIKKLGELYLDSVRVEADKLGFTQAISITHAVTDTYGDGIAQHLRSALTIDENEIDPEGLYSASKYNVPFTVDPGDELQYEVTITWTISVYNPNPVAMTNGYADMSLGVITEEALGVRPALLIYDQLAIEKGRVYLTPDTFETFGSEYPDMTGLPAARLAEDNYVSFNGRFNVDAYSSRFLCSGEETFVINATELNLLSEIKLYKSLEVKDIGNPYVFHQLDAVYRKASRYDMDITDIAIKIAPSTDSGVLPYSTINLGSFLPKKVKQSDWLKSIFQKYNLYSIPDPNNARKIIYQTRDDFYRAGNLIDLTELLVKEIDQQTFFLPEITSKKLILSYADDKDDYILEAYKGETNETYGQVEVTFDNENVKGIQRNEEIFSPTVNMPTSFGAVTPVLAADFKYNTRTLLDGGTLDCRTYFIRESLSSKTQLNQYPYAGMLNHPYRPTFSLEYAQPDYYSYNIPHLTNNNLYIKWRGTMAQMNEGKMYKAYFQISPALFQKIQLNDIIKVKESFFIINAIIDYDANSQGPTLFELITTEDDLKLPSIGRNSATADPSIPSIPAKPNVPVTNPYSVAVGLSKVAKIRYTVTSTVANGVDVTQSMGVGNVLGNRFSGQVIGNYLRPIDNGFFINKSSLTDQGVNLNDEVLVNNVGLMIFSDDGNIKFFRDGMLQTNIYIEDDYWEDDYVGDNVVGVTMFDNTVIVHGDLVPENATTNLGSPTSKWKDIYIGGNIISEDPNISINYDTTLQVTTSTDNKFEVETLGPDTTIKLSTDDVALLGESSIVMDPDAINIKADALILDAPTSVGNLGTPLVTVLTGTISFDKDAGTVSILRGTVAGTPFGITLGPDGAAYMTAIVDFPALASANMTVVASVDSTAYSHTKDFICGTYAKTTTSVSVAVTTIGDAWSSGALNVSFTIMLIA